MYSFLTENRKHSKSSHLRNCKKHIFCFITDIDNLWSVLLYEIISVLFWAPCVDFRIKSTCLLNNHFCVFEFYSYTMEAWNMPVTVSHWSFHSVLPAHRGSSIQACFSACEGKAWACPATSVRVRLERLVVDRSGLNLWSEWPQPPVTLRLIPPLSSFISISLDLNPASLRCLNSHLSTRPSHRVS